MIEHEERALIESIIEFGDTVAREVMVPRPDMVSLQATTASTSRWRSDRAGYSRLPVFAQGDRRRRRDGYMKDLMKAEREGRGMRRVADLRGRPVHARDQTGRRADAEMQADKYHMALVVDEYGGTAGLVTLEDLPRGAGRRDRRRVRHEEARSTRSPMGLPGRRRPADRRVNELVASHLPEGDWDTVGGFALRALGHVPAEGENVEFDGAPLPAEEVEGRRDRSVLVAQ